MNSRNKFCILAGCLLATNYVFAIEIDDFTSAENDRFANDPSFVMNDYDLSGVGRSNDGRWATLVSRNVFVSADHFHPKTDGSARVTFSLTNDPDDETTVTRTVARGQRIDSSDIWMGVLETALPEGYAVYDFATEDIANETEFGASVYNGENAYMFGRSPNFSGTEDVAVGRNVLDGWRDNMSAAGTTDDALTADVERGASDVPYEALLEGRDSGAPMFVDDADANFDLRLVGSNWIVEETVGSSSNVNGFAYFGNYDQQMQQVIDSHPIPEPGSLALLSLGGLAALVMLARKRRLGR
ncbi:MAG: PEP-CTERM sorting domain-containing protein [Pirellulaceae bacterium]